MDARSLKPNEIPDMSSLIKPQYFDTFVKAAQSGVFFGDLLLYHIMFCVLYIPSSSKFVFLICFMYLCQLLLSVLSHNI